MKQGKPYVLLMLVSIFLILSNCKKDEAPCCDITNPEYPNYDPCWDASEVTADFTISERFGSAARYYKSIDSAFVRTALYFKAEEEDATSYTWYLGAEVITEREFERTFHTVDFYNPITVTLVVEKEPRLDCYPEDDGVDTLTRTFWRVHQCQSLVVGNYRGVWTDEPLDTFIVGFELVDYVGAPDSCDQIQVYNLHKNIEDTCKVSGLKHFGYNWWKFGSHVGNSCYENRGEISVISNNSVEIDYTIGYNEEQEHHIFHGVRIE